MLLDDFSTVTENIDCGNSCQLRIIEFLSRCPEAIQCDSSVVVVAVEAAAAGEEEEATIATILRCVAAAWTTEVCGTRLNRLV